MNLNTAEKFLLIAQHPSKGRFMTGDLQINYGIIGALLLDMTLENKIAIEDDRLILKNESNSVDNTVISEITSIIRNSQKQRKIRYWVNKLSQKSNIYKRSIMDGMEMKGLIQIEHLRFLGLIPYRKSYLTDSRSRDSLIKQIRECVLFHKELNNENIVVLGLIEACRMHNIISSDRDELKTLRKELKVIIKESPIAEAVDKTIKQVQAAIMGAVAASSVAATAGHH
jgi:golgi phosphoprotein 3